MWSNAKRNPSHGWGRRFNSYRAHHTRPTGGRLELDLAFPFAAVRAMKWAICFALVIGVSVTTGPARAAVIRDGDELLKYCTATIGAYMDYCFGYVDAIADLMLGRASVASVDACIPATRPDDPTLRNIVVAYLRRAEVSRRQEAPTLVARALAEAYPCDPNR